LVLLNSDDLANFIFVPILFDKIELEMINIKIAYLVVLLNSDDLANLDFWRCIRELEFNRLLLFIIQQIKSESKF
jgi:hypothetical protein